MLPINAHTDVSSKARRLNFGLSFCLHPCLVYATSEGSSPEPAVPTDAISTKILCTDTYGKQKLPLAFDTIHFIYSCCHNACLFLFLILWFCLHEYIILAYVV